MAKLIRFPVELETRLTAYAERQRRSLTAQIVLFVERQLEIEEEEERRRAGERRDG